MELMYNDSMINLHKIAKFRSNCLFQRIRANQTARQVSVNSFPSREEFSSYMDKIVTTEWLNPEPRQHFCDRLWSQFPH